LEISWNVSFLRKLGQTAELSNRMGQIGLRVTRNLEGVCGV